MNPGVVVKVGGSLLDWSGLPGRLAGYLATRLDERPVVVVGGGRVADVVRALDQIHALGDERSHDLALRALDLTAALLAAIVPGLSLVKDTEECGGVWNAGLVPVLAPRRFLERDEARTRDPLPRSWDVTTDAIAARLAARLHAGELVLLKSAPLPVGIDRREAARLGLVDPAFPGVSGGIDRVVYLNLRAPSDSGTLLP